MEDSYDVTLTLWPATPLPACVAHELRELGVDLATLSVKDGSLAARRTRNGTLVLELSLAQRPFGLSDLEAALARMRIARISYLARESHTGSLTGAALAFERGSAIERQLTVTAAGEPVLTAGDLAHFDGRYGTAEALIESLQAWLRPPAPRRLTTVAAGELTIAVVPDEEDDELEETSGTQGGDGV
jgi:hypothetical protein